MFEAPTTPDIPGLTDVELPTEDSDRVLFETGATRTDDMHSAAAAWFEKLSTDPDESQTVYLLDRWLDVASSLYDFSAKNTVLLSLQDPNASFAIDYDTWNEEHKTRVESGTRSRFLWDSVVEPMCPECGNGPTRHNRTDCEYDETGPEDWTEGVVGFAPSPVFTADQTQSGRVPPMRQLWEGVSSKQSAEHLRNAIVSAQSYYGIAPTKADPLPTEERYSVAGTHSTSTEGAAVLNLKSGVSNTSTKATAGGPELAPLDASAETDYYTWQASVEVPTEECPEEAAVSASVRQIAKAVLTGNTNKSHASDQITPHNPLSSMEQENRTTEAELVSHLVARRVGIDPPRELGHLPLDNWFGEHHTEICSRIERVLNTANFLIKPVDRRCHGAQSGSDLSQPEMPR